jgi:hypothetical protein
MLRGAGSAASFLLGVQLARFLMPEGLRAWLGMVQ